jgi:hypothetical protein
MFDFTYLECYIQSIYLFEFCLLIAYFLSINIEIFDIIIVEISLKSIHDEFSLEHVFKAVQFCHIEIDISASISVRKILFESSNIEWWR